MTQECRRTVRQVLVRAVCAAVWTFSAATLFVTTQTGRASAEPDWGNPAPTCRADGSATRLKAPAPLPLEEVTAADPDISDKLALRRTINVAGPWLDRDLHDIRDYGVVWHSWTQSPGGNGIWMRELLWVNFKPGREDAYRYHSAEFDRFKTNEPWQRDTEYDKSFQLRIDDPAYADFLADTVEATLKRSGTDGILLDWWIDEQPYMSADKVRGARDRIARTIRSRVGPGPLMMGNTGWTRDSTTHSELNGVFMELWKKPSDRGYSCAEILRIEDLLAFHDRYLAQPKLVVLEPWRQAASSSRSDRKSDVNIAWARMFTAMSAVVPRSGYILYSDNARDRDSDDHGHEFYDFYDIDLGKPTSGATPVTRGVGYRLFQDGAVAYNATPVAIELDLLGGTVTLPPLGAAFCRGGDGQWDCSL